MAISVIGGMLTSTLLTLLIIPVMYLVMDDISEKVKSFASRFSSSEEGLEDYEVELDNMEPETDNPGGRI